MRFVRPIVTAVAVAAVFLAVVVGGIGASRGMRWDFDAFVPIAAGIGCVGLGFVASVILSRHLSRKMTSAGTPGNFVGSLHTLAFTVGDQEKHAVDFTFDQTRGWITIRIDDVVTVKKLVTVSFRLVRTFNFTVGEHEVHQVRIEKRRALIASFARPQPIKGFVDGVLVAENNGLTVA